MGTLLRKTTKELYDFLLQRLKPYVDQGKILVLEEDVSGEGTIAVDTYRDIPAHIGEPHPHYLKAADINFPYAAGKYVADDVKRAQFRVEEELLLRRDSILAAHIYLGKKYSLFNKKDYRPVESQPVAITTDVNGVNRPIAKLSYILSIPYDTIQEMASYMKQHESCQSLKVTVAGSAALSGGYAVSIGGRQWLEYNVTVVAEQLTIAGAI